MKFTVRGISVVFTFLAALLCLVPGVCCGSGDEVLPSPVASLSQDQSQALLALRPTAGKDRKAAPSAPAAPDFTHSLGMYVKGIWGTASNETTFSDGKSRLDWPLDFQLVGGSYRGSFRDLAEWEVSLEGCPWTRSVDDMKDYDWLDDSVKGYPFHDGVDIYSESATDSRAMILDTALRVFALSRTYASMGVFMGFQAQDMEFKTYDTRQRGYGPWAPAYTLNVNGHTSNYSLNTEIFSLGLTWRLKAGDRASLTLDTAFIPYAHISDEDDHLLRYRTSESDCDGTGTMLSLTGKFALTGKWYLASSCSRIRVNADGHQSQYWWGNDPEGAGDETGSSVGGIDSDMEQDSFNIRVSLNRTF